MQGSSIWSMAFALGAVQGLVIALALLSLRGGNKVAARTAGLLVLVIAAMLAEESIDAGRLAGAWPWSVGATISFELLIGPLLYLFVRAVAQPRTAFFGRDLLHFLPFAFSIALLLPFYALSGTERLALLNGDTPSSVIAIFVVKPVHFVVYLALTLRLLRESAPAGRARPTLHDRAVLWVRRGVLTMAGVMAVSVALLALSAFGIDVFVGSDRFSGLALTAATYGLTFATFRAGTPAGGLAFTTKPAKYSTSSLSAEEKRAQAGRLATHMRSAAPYLDFDFRLETLAKGVGLPIHHVSQILNEELGCSFREFVNQHRVEHAKALIKDPMHRRETLLSIAMESGFSSKASFNRAFKRYAGLTPSAYRSQSN